MEHHPRTTRPVGAEAAAGGAPATTQAAQRLGSGVTDGHQFLSGIFSAKLKWPLFACTVQVQKSYCAMGQRLLQRPSYGCLYKGSASYARRRRNRSPVGRSPNLATVTEVLLASLGLLS